MSENFIDELLRESEEKEIKLSYEYADLILLEIKSLQNKINHVSETAKKEIQILEEWSLNKAVKYQDRIDFLAKKLNQFILEANERTIDLANGTIRLRKGREKLEVFDLNKFLSNKYSPELVNLKQEVKPDMQKIKDFINRSGKVPEGVKVIPGNENEFSYKIKGGPNGSET
jgi:phage host-nuclease inhibitor protein Gam